MKILLLISMLIFYWFVDDLDTHFGVIFDDFHVIFALLFQASISYRIFIDCSWIWSSLLPKLWRFYCRRVAKINVFQAVRTNCFFTASYIDFSIFVDAGDLNNNEVYGSTVRLNYNLTDKMQISSKVIYSDIQHAKIFDSYESSGANLSISRIFPFGTFTASATYLTNVFDARKITVSSLKDREDTSLVTNFILRGDINQLLPFFKKINKDNSIYYTISLRESDVNSTISSYEIERSFKKIGISKRINFND